MKYAFSSMGPSLEWIALGLIFIGLFAAVGVAFLLGGLPGKIARERNHPQRPMAADSAAIASEDGAFADQLSKLEAMVTILEQQRLEKKS